MHKSGLVKYHKYGPIVKETVVPGADVLFLFDPNDIATVLNDKNSKDFPQRRSHLALAKYRTDRPHVYNSAGLLPTNGPEWWRLRSELQKGLSSPKHVRGFLPDVDSVTYEFVNNLKTDIITDFLPELSRLNLEIICLLAFDERMDSFSSHERKSTSRTSRLMRAAQTTNTSTLPTDQGFQIWRYFETPTYKKIRKSQNYLENVAVDFISQKLSYYKDDSETKNTNNTSRSSLLEEYIKNPNLDLSDIVGMAVDLLLAGVETTTFSTCFALYHLAKNSEVQEKLYLEAVEVLKNESDNITPEILNSKIPYTRAVLKETLRLNPISVGVGRILNVDTILSGYNVPKGTVVVTQNLVASRLSQNFINPEKFLPERWMERKNSINPYVVLPFGHGMRACIARRLAEQSMLVLLLRVIRKYSISWCGKDVMDIKTLLINNPDQPVKICLRKRDS